MTEQNNKKDPKPETPPDDPPLQNVGHGIKIKVNPDGSIIIYTNAPVDVKPAIPGNDPDAIGTVCPDGSVYAGLSPETGKAMYTTPHDAPLRLCFEDATKYAASLDAHGHQDWSLPTLKELTVLFNNKAAIGNFNTSDSYSGWYRASTENYDGTTASVRRFKDGAYYYYYKDSQLAFRCIRRGNP